MTSAVAQASVSHAPFGKLPDGSTVEGYTLKSNSVEIHLISYGARVTSIKTADRHGKVADIALGYSTLEPYYKLKNNYFGVVPGRFANRIGKGKFTLDGHHYQITVNNNGNMLHGGTVGFDQKNWSSKEIPNGVEFTLVSPDGDQGFPGKLTAHVKYTLVGDTVHIDYSATTDKDTVVNLTNHTYFNLSGEGSGTILNEKLEIPADSITPIDSGLIPTGKLMPVAGTPFDFNHLTAIGARIDQKNEQLEFAGGYDHNFVLKGKMGEMHLAAKVVDPATGRVLTVDTDQPGVQFYSGNFLDGTATGPSGRPYIKRSALCLETQHFPDSPNHPNFPSTELKPGQTYHTVTTWTFTTEK